MCRTHVIHTLKKPPLFWALDFHQAMPHFRSGFRSVAGIGFDDLETWTPNIGHRVLVFDSKGERARGFRPEGQICEKLIYHCARLFARKVAYSLTSSRNHAWRAGKRIDSIGSDLPGEAPSQFCYLHSVAVDSRGDVYAVRHIQPSSVFRVVHRR